MELEIWDAKGKAFITKEIKPNIRGSQQITVGVVSGSNEKSKVMSCTIKGTKTTLSHNLLGPHCDLKDGRLTKGCEIFAPTGDDNIIANIRAFRDHNVCMTGCGKMCELQVMTNVSVPQPALEYSNNGSTMTIKEYSVTGREHKIEIAKGETYNAYGGTFSVCEHGTYYYGMEQQQPFTGCGGGTRKYTCRNYLMTKEDCIKSEYCTNSGSSLRGDKCIIPGNFFPQTIESIQKSGDYILVLSCTYTIESSDNPGSGGRL